MTARRHALAPGDTGPGWAGAPDAGQDWAVPTPGADQHAWADGGGWDATGTRSVRATDLGPDDAPFPGAHSGPMDDHGTDGVRDAAGTGRTAPAAHDPAPPVLSMDMPTRQPTTETRADADTLAAEVALLRAELDLLRQAFMRHCLETG